MGNFIVIAILVIIVSGIVYYLYKEKKKGNTCIWCPYAGGCTKQKKGDCGSKPTQSP